MPSPFDITTATNTVTLDNKREGVAVFTVRNATRRRLRATARLTTTPPEGAQWLSLHPPESGDAAAPYQRDFPIDSTQQLQVKIAVPATAAPGSYTLKLTLADEVNPDENFTTSPDVLFTVREVPKPEPKPFPVWIIPVIVIAVLVIGAIIVGGVALSQPQPTPTPAGPCVVTFTAPTFVYTTTTADMSFLFDQIQSGEFTATGRLADNTWLQLDHFGSWFDMSSVGTTAEIRGGCNTLPIAVPPTPAP
jgi:hypothetical protein